MAATALKWQQKHLDRPASHLFLFLYSALLTLALVLSAPWWLWRMATTNRYREGLAQRLGLISPALRATVEQAHSQNRRILWLHAVSVGEVLASARLVQELEQELEAALPNHLILISTTTLTGQHLARERFGTDRVFYLPLDFAAPVRRYLRLLRPDVLLLMESELWPRLLAECRRARIPVAVLNARISDRSYPRYLRLRPLWRRIFTDVTLFLAQGEETAARLRNLGAPPARIQTPGNLKYDLPPTHTNAMTKRIASILGSFRLLVAGSTLPGEENLILAAWPALLLQFPDTILLIAPRHPQRFQEAAELLTRHGSDFKRASLLTNITPQLQPGSILLLDTLGDLASVYSLASVAFIGGSLVPKGGHNPLEAARFGVPIVMGPSYENFREIVEGMIAANAIRITDESHLTQTLTELLQNDQGIGKNAQAFFQSQSGATARTIAALLPLIRTQKPGAAA